MQNIIISNEDIKLDKVIGRGATAIIYQINSNQVIKLFNEGYRTEEIYLEFQKSSIFHQKISQSVKCYGIIPLKTRNGLIFDFVDGQTLLDCFIEDPKSISIYDFSRLHKRILDQRCDKKYNVKKQIFSYINKSKYTQETKMKLLDLLNGLPDGDALCHGDYHFGNIVKTSNKLVVVDYLNMCSGHKTYDIARTVFLMEFTESKNTDSYVTKSERSQITNQYLKYMKVSRMDIEKWLIIICAIRCIECPYINSTEKENTRTFLKKHHILV